MEHSTKLNGVRLLLILAVVIGITSLVLDFRFDNTLTAARTAAYGVDRELDALQLSIADLRTAEVGYMASGQDPMLWMRRADELAQTIASGFTRVRALPLDAVARTRVDAAAAAFDLLLDVDGRARQGVIDDLHLVASDAVFVEAADAATRVTAEISSARAAEAEAAERALGQTSRLRIGTQGAALGLVLILTLIAVRLSQQPPASEAATMAQMLRELPPPVKATPLSQPANPRVLAPPPPAPVASSPSNPVAVPVPTALPSMPAPETVMSQPAAVVPEASSSQPAAERPAVNLPAAAELCGDLARVIDERDVPVLLERAATILDATGVILWVAGPEHGQLQPMLTHGYPDKVLRRLGTLDIDDDNVTSLAFRSMRSQQVSGGDGSAAAAIAVPLVTANGCTGVLAAEVRTARLAPDSVALARIIAAQFATIIAPAEPAASQAAQA